LRRTRERKEEEEKLLKKVLSLSILDRKIELDKDKKI
jgi:hypothetical protein